MIDVVARREAILTRCYEIFRRAEAQYGVNLGRVEILFNLRGRVAGMACCRRNRFSGAPATDLKLRFNVDMIAGDGYDHILNDCVPHEIAHLVCYANPQLGANHDRGWKRVCVALGGNGERCHTEDVLMAKGNTYRYVTSTGAEIQVGDRHHAKIQSGAVLHAHRKLGGGSITRQSQYVIVGVNGRPITPGVVTAPVIKQTPVTTPTAQPEIKPQAGVARTVLVRAWIRLMVSQGHSKNYCEDMCGRVFGMAKAQGKSYVSTQWVRAMSTQD